MPAEGFFQPFIDPTPHDSVQDDTHPMVRFIANAALSHKEVCALSIAHTTRFDLHSGNAEFGDRYALVKKPNPEGLGSHISFHVDLGTDPVDALHRLAAVFMQAIDLAVAESKDRRIVEAYKAYKNTADTDTAHKAVVTALWNLMSNDERDLHEGYHFQEDNETPPAKP